MPYFVKTPQSLRKKLLIKGIAGNFLTLDFLGSYMVVEF